LDTQRSVGGPGYFGGAAFFERARAINETTRAARATRLRPRIKPYQKLFENIFEPLDLTFFG
jgi:hypothetical protein